MSLQVVLIADYHVSSSAEDILVTYALGSCVAVLLHDSAAGVGGLLHILLPDSSLDPRKAKLNPLTFANTGVPILFQKAYALGAAKQRMRVCLVGGAQVNAGANYFHVGAENIRATRNILQENGVTVHRECVGGTSARTVRLQVGTGRISLQETQIGAAKPVPAHVRIA